jgi:hypothetical protein
MWISRADNCSFLKAISRDSSFFHLRFKVIFSALHSTFVGNSFLCSLNPSVSITSPIFLIAFFWCRLVKYCHGQNVDAGNRTSMCGILVEGLSPGAIMIDLVVDLVNVGYVE